MQKIYDEKDRVTAKAERLCVWLGEGWQSRVWQNMGWHFEAHWKGLIHVYPSSRRDGTWFCMIGECGMAASLAPDKTFCSPDPKQVVRLTVAAYKAKWLAMRAEQDQLVAAGEECVKEET
jgi:hypothetical protein